MTTRPRPGMAQTEEAPYTPLEIEIPVHLRVKEVCEPHRHSYGQTAKMWRILPEELISSDSVISPKA